MTCCGGRGAGDQQGSVEEEGAKRLNREDWRVAPGEARDALEWAMSAARQKADEYKFLADRQESYGYGNAARLNREMEAIVRKAEKTLKALIPKPDSEAPEERSGRRNAPGLATAPQDSAT